MVWGSIHRFEGPAELGEVSRRKIFLLIRNPSILSFSSLRRRHSQIECMSIAPALIDRFRKTLTLFFLEDRLGCIGKWAGRYTPCLSSLWWLHHELHPMESRAIGCIMEGLLSNKAGLSRIRASKHLAGLTFLSALDGTW